MTPDIKNVSSTILVTKLSREVSLKFLYSPAEFFLILSPLKIQSTFSLITSLLKTKFCCWTLICFPGQNQATGPSRRKKWDLVHMLATAPGVTLSFFDSQHRKISKFMEEIWKTCLKFLPRPWSGFICILGWRSQMSYFFIYNLDHESSTHSFRED